MVPTIDSHSESTQDRIDKLERELVELRKRLRDVEMTRAAYPRPYPYPIIPPAPYIPTYPYPGYPPQVWW